MSLSDVESHVRQFLVAQSPADFEASPTVVLEEIERVYVLTGNPESEAD